MTDNDTLDTTCETIRQSLGASCHAVSETETLSEVKIMMRQLPTDMACRGLLRLWFILRLVWYSVSNVAADKPKVSPISVLS